jgi:poly(3-hydroxybutyrate) depolymerase
MTHDGGGASQSIANMVRFVVDTYSVDEGRVVVQGVSSGGLWLYVSSLLIFSLSSQVLI